MAKLFGVIGTTHSVDEDSVRRSLGRRRTGLDITVGFCFAVLYGIAAYAIAGRVNRLYPGGEGGLHRLAMTVYTSLIVSLVGTLLGGLWAGILESLRVGSGHLSYRSARIPWDHHGLALFAGGAVLFWILVALRYQASGRAGDAPRMAGHQSFNLDSTA